MKTMHNVLTVLRLKVLAIIDHHHQGHQEQQIVSKKRFGRTRAKIKSVVSRTVGRSTDNWLQNL